MGKERDGSDLKVDGQETVGNILGKERDGSNDKVDGGETVGNGLGGAPLAGSAMERRQRERKPWEIARDELQLGNSCNGKEGDGSDDRVDGGETVGNSLGRASLGKERDGSDDTVDRGETVGNRSRRAPLGRREMEATI